MPGQVLFQGDGPFAIEEVVVETAGTRLMLLW